ncbi:ferritin-like domain-containing protein [Psychrobacillus sp. NPDC096623]|uniref:ferritin-like domain-containing protein n=1 Tax=Psychrobacillus sp. NPDC096623 TaxID=3364492 RepID=UPI0037FF4D30
MNNHTNQTSTYSSLLADLTKTINSEFTAIHCYEQLASIAPSEEVKNRILEIRKDEMRHFQTFSSIYLSLTGMHPSPQITEQCPTNFQNGVISSFNDEQEAVDFYHEVARKHPIVMDVYNQIAADEQNHAVWFLFFKVNNFS